MDHIKRNLYELKNQMDYLDPNRSVSVDPTVAKDSWKYANEILVILHEQLDAVVDVIKLLDINKEGN